MSQNEKARGRIFLVEDDERLGSQIEMILKRAGYQVAWEQDGSRAAKRGVEDADLVVLDLMLPGTYGMELLKVWRKRADVPILILSARDNTADKVRALELGADDYVIKPFHPEELLARISARLRRPDVRRSGNNLVVADIVVSLERRSVHIAGQLVEFTKVELDLLAALMKRPGAALSRHALVEAALDPERDGSERTLDVHVSRLRKKIADSGASIETVWGVGYRIVEGTKE